jgi:uncharacterized protein
MTRPLFQLGSFQFDLPNGVPQTLDRQADYRWEEQDRLFREPAAQFLGPGSQAISLSGVLFPGFSGRQSTMEQLRQQAAQGAPEMLTDGLGRIYGKWGIRRVREQQNTFAPGGGARQISFDVELVKYAEDNPGQAASPLSVQPGSPLASAVSQAVGEATFQGPGSAFDAIGWSQAVQFQGLTQQATQSGFSLGQLATIASTGAQIASQVNSGSYVSAALRTFGLLGIPVSQSGAWAQIGINAAGLAQSYATGRGPTGMALALSAASLAGTPALAASGIVRPDDVASINTLLKAAATVGTILEVDPKTTAALRPLVTLP